MKKEDISAQLAQQMRETVIGPETLVTEGDVAVTQTMANDPAASHSAAGFPQEPVVAGPEPTPDKPEPPVEPVDDTSGTQEPPVEPEPDVEVTETDRVKLSEEEMKEMYATGVVNGEEVEYSLDQLLAIAQTQDAVSDRLDRTKQLERELRTLVEDVKSQKTQPVTEETKPEFLSEQDEQIYQLRQELRNLKSNLVQTETLRLVDTEDAQIRQIAKDELGTDDMKVVAKLIERVQNQDPNFTAVTNDLFSRPPQDVADMQRRLAMFRSTITMGKGLEVPHIVRAAKAEGIQEGKKETMEKVKKESLTTVSSTAPPPTESMAKQLAKAQAQPGIGGFVNVWKKNFGDSIPKQ